MVVDDHLLVRILSNQLAPVGDVAVTGHWYYRACRAAIAGRDGGWLNRTISRTPAAAREALRRSLLRLPSSIELVSLRDLVPTMATLSARHRLNVLALEALAAAVHLGVGIHVSAANIGPKLRDAAAAEGVPHVVVA